MSNFFRSLDVVIEQVSAWRSEDSSIVFTNGCFDILHPGHIHCLQQAKSMGDYLVVGLNSDDSVRRLKGEERPYHAQDQRAMQLMALNFSAESLSRFKPVSESFSHRLTHALAGLPFTNIFWFSLSSP